MRRALARLVAAAGYRAQAYDCAEDAAASGEVSRAGCLVVDVQLPGMSGSEWVASLDRGPPAVFVSASVDAAVECLQKPFAGSALLDAIGRALGDR
jgi:FixJ family two-component response regulator